MNRLQNKFTFLSSVALLGLNFLFQSGCSHLFYQPSRETLFDPAQLKLKYDEVQFSTKDGVALHGWYFPAQTLEEDPKKTVQKKPKSKGVLVQFHGNAENISTHFFSLAWVSQAGYDFFTFDYRGYGKSGGSPSQEGLNQDALAAIAYVKKKNSPGPKYPNIFLYGQSLGGAVVLRAMQDLEDRSRIATIFIDSSFYSYRAIARGKLAQSWLTYIFQPLAYLLVSDAYSPEEAIPRLSPTPLVVIHGEKDRIVPIEFGEKIFELAHPPKEFWRIPNGTHIDSMLRHRGKYREKLIRLMDSISAVKSP